MDLAALFAPISAWFDTHPAAIAWFAGWLAALSIAQTIKQILPPAWDVTAAKRVSQLVAMVTGACVSFALWPGTTGHAAVFAFLVGASAPTCYTMLKAVIEWRSPRLAEAFGWQRIQERAGVVPECQKPPDNDACSPR
ncbi:MAG: hypothetical protein P4L92_22970 [Rudaea sp.]|nr:hypothetical protein [Rudaea sp.]